MPPHQNSPSKKQTIADADFPQSSIHSPLADPSIVSTALGTNDQPAFYRSALVENLAHEVRKLETAGRPLDNSPIISSGCQGMDECLANQGYLPGCVIEYLRSAPGCGASYLAFSAAASAMQITKGFLVVVDPQHSIYPPALVAQGIDLRQVVMVRPKTPPDALWTVDQALRTPAVAAVVAELDQIDDRTARRFQLAAEKGHGLALLLRSSSARQQPSWAEVQWLVRSADPFQHGPVNQRPPIESPLSALPSQHAPAQHAFSASSTSTARPISMEPVASKPHPRRPITIGRELQVQLLRNRGGQAGAKLHLTINPFTGALQSQPTPMRERNRHEQKAAVRLATELARPTSPSRRATAG